MVAPKKKSPGRPKEKGGKVFDAAFLLDDDGADFMDSFDPDTAKRPAAQPAVEPPVQSRVAPIREPEPVVREVRDTPAPIRRPAPAVQRPPKKRPPRMDIGKRPELEKACALLLQHGVSNSAEPMLNNTDIVAAATAAIARAANGINYSRIQPRGHYRSVTAKALHDELEQAYFRALGEHFVERHAHQLSDRVLRSCYELYRQRMAVDEDDGLPNISN